jgi:hypothetical protein
MTRQTQEDIGAHLDRLLREGQVRLEITGGTRTWRLLPSLRNQKLIDRMRATISPLSDAPAGCGCYHISDANLRFPDGSLKRPDIAIFCIEPPDIDESWEQVPEAVIEIVSPDYETKDLSINPPWYLTQGVQDVLVVDPRADQVTHFQAGNAPREHTRPFIVALQCGCRVTV